ncbi:hypothetical protein BDN70DRAFT_271602 [Pholiota conissans]|uniref:Uncharacterized protein n=1 Tax=Pholiota conissans TaxID=109636 RepID=A0A9P5YSP4_9AGAR|nr:hypothetical protein BDN70DRAFT_271602 [Pholiota conissans]
MIPGERRNMTIVWKYVCSFVHFLPTTPILVLPRNFASTAPLSNMCFSLSLLRRMACPFPSPEEIRMLGPIHLTRTIAGQHFFPCSTLPAITSHVRPHFVIFILMSKLERYEIKHNSFIEDGLYSSLFFRHGSLSCALTLCAKLYDIRTFQNTHPGFSPFRASTTEPEPGDNGVAGLSHNSSCL